MADFGDRPLVGPGSEFRLAIDKRAVPHREVLAGEPVLSPAPAREMLHEVGEGTAVNLYAAGERARRPGRHAGDPAAVRGDLAFGE